MPRFSICISSYMDAAYLPACLDSVLKQSFSDFEVIVVDDGSTDDTFEVLERYASLDGRVHPYRKEVNEGVHLGRMDAVFRASGDYLLFLDSDDRILPDLLLALAERLRGSSCDYLHVGARVIGDEVSRAMSAGSSAQANDDVPIGSSADLLHYAYEYEGGYRLDWRVWQRAYATSLVKKAFAHMPRVRLGRGQDSYEHLVIASFAQHPATAHDIIGYEYHLGRGITTDAPQSVEFWRHAVESYGSCCDLADELACSLARPEVARAAAGLREKLSENAMNDLVARVDAREREGAVLFLAGHLGRPAAAAQVFRLVRDEAYRLWVAGLDIPAACELLAWFAKADELAGECAQDVSAIQRYREPAQTHLNDLMRRSKDRGKKPACAIRRLIGEALEKIR